ncbi:MAG: preprotein translocase subunit SecG [Micavibrio sp.]|nr:preprotein translocase subunit SecG [Micavibrio sp.]
MEAVLLVIHLIVAVAIIITILVQPSEAGGFMGNSGSMSNMMAPRRGADVLTRATTILAALFFLTSMMLAISANSHPSQRSILDINTDDSKPAVTGAAETPKAPVEDSSATVTGDKPADAAPAEKAPAEKAEDKKAAVKEPAKKKSTPKAPIAK